MTLKTFTIELRVDFDDKEKEQLILQSARMAAKHLFTTASLVADKRKPQIALSTSDMFEGAEQISLAEDIPMEPLQPVGEPTDTSNTTDEGAAQ